MLYEDTSLKLAWELYTFAPDYYLSDSFKYYDTWEIITPNDQSNQVVLRMSYHFDWVNKPWLLSS